MDELKHKQRTVVQIMADADLMDRARREYEESHLPTDGRAARLSFLRTFLDPRIQHA